MRTELNKVLDTMQICPPRGPLPGLTWAIDALADWKAGNRALIAEDARARALKEAAEVQAQFETNVYGATFVAQAALPALKASRGAIVNISSAAGHKPSPGGGHYAASKAALESLTRSWALELAPHGVRVNAVAAGPTETPGFDKTGRPELGGPSIAILVCRGQPVRCGLLQPAPPLCADAAPAEIAQRAKTSAIACALIRFLT